MPCRYPTFSYVQLSFDSFKVRYRLLTVHNFFIIAHSCITNPILSLKSEPLPGTSHLSYCNFVILHSFILCTCVVQAFHYLPHQFLSQCHILNRLICHPFLALDPLFPFKRFISTHFPFNC